MPSPIPHMGPMKLRNSWCLPGAANRSHAAQLAILGGIRCRGGFAATIVQKLNQSARALLAITAPLPSVLLHASWQCRCWSGLATDSAVEWPRLTLPDIFPAVHCSSQCGWNVCLLALQLMPCDALEAHVPVGGVHAVYSCRVGRTAAQGL